MGQIDYPTRLIWFFHKLSGCFLDVQCFGIFVDGGRQVSHQLMMSHASCFAGGTKESFCKGTESELMSHDCRAYNAAAGSLRQRHATIACPIEGLNIMCFTTPDNQGLIYTHVKSLQKNCAQWHPARQPVAVHGYTSTLVPGRGLLQRSSYSSHGFSE